MRLIEHVIKYLVENRFDDAMDKWPRYDADLEKLERCKELKNPAKYIDWFINQRRLYYRDPDEVLEVIVDFEKNSLRLDNKDINAYEYLDLQNALAELKPTRTELKRTGAVKIFESGLYRFYHITTRAAAQYYGRKTKWCISATLNNQFGYCSGYDFFFAIAKRSRGSEFDKIALQCRHRAAAPWPEASPILSLWDAEDDEYVMNPFEYRDVRLRRMLKLTDAELDRLIEALNASIKKECS